MRGFDTGLPESFPVVDKPVGELLHFDTSILHDLGFLLFSRIRMSNVFWTHDPVLEVFDRLSGETGRLALSASSRRKVAGTTSCHGIGWSTHTDGICRESVMGESQVGSTKWYDDVMDVFSIFSRLQPGRNARTQFGDVANSHVIWST